jgi:hypothetical protein
MTVPDVNEVTAQVEGMQIAGPAAGVTAQQVDSMQIAGPAAGVAAQQVDRMQIAGSTMTAVAALSTMKAMLGNGEEVDFVELFNNSFTVYRKQSTWGAGVELTAGNRLKVMLEQEHVAPMQVARGRMTIWSTTLALRINGGGRTVLVRKTRNNTGHNMVRFVQPLTEEGVDNCAQLILAVFARAPLDLIQD